MQGTITVLVNSYTRMAYLNEALASAVNQDVDRPFEVVLVRANPRFRISSENESTARTKGITIVPVDVPPGPVGFALSRGFSASSGDYISILDDDDLWEPHKLRTIGEALDSAHDAVYIHNGQTFVDERNSALSSVSTHRIIRHPSSMVKGGQSTLIDTRDAKAVSRCRYYGADFNNSSTTIRRDLVTSAKFRFDRVKRGEDSILFYLALASQRKILLLSDRLTRYRIHKSGSTAAILAGSTTARTESSLRFLQDERDSVRLAREALSIDVAPEVRWLLDSDLAYWESLCDIATGAVSRDSSGSRIRTLLGSRRIRPGTREVYVALALTLAGFLPWLAKSCFLTWRRIW